MIPWLATLWLLSTPFQEALAFARYLDQQGDPYRAILEYRRALFLLPSPDTLTHDALVLRIAQLQEKLDQPLKALQTLEEAWDTTAPAWRFERGRAYFLQGLYGQARRSWQGRDTLVGWTYLREHDFRKAARYLGPIPPPPRRHPWLAAVLSAAMPGLGKVYAGHPWDGLFSFLVHAFTGWRTYRSVQEHRPVATAIYGSLFAFFYAGNVYGSYVAARQYNQTQIAFRVAETEVHLGLWRYLP